MPLRDDLYAILNSLPQISRLSVSARRALGIDERLDAWVTQVLGAADTVSRRWPGAADLVMSPLAMARRLGGIGGSEIGVLMADAEHRPQAFFDSDTRNLVARKLLLQPPQEATSATVRGNILESTARSLLENQQPTYVRLDRVDEDLGAGVLAAIRATAPPAPALTPEQKAVVFASPDDVFYDAATDEVVLVDYKVSGLTPHTETDDPVFCQYRDQLNWYALSLALKGLRVDQAAIVHLNIHTMESSVIPMPLDPARQIAMARVAHEVWSQHVLAHKRVPGTWAQPVDLPADPVGEDLAVRFAVQAQALEVLTAQQAALAQQIAERARAAGSRPDVEREYFGRAKIAWKLPVTTVSTYATEATALWESSGLPVPRSLDKLDWETVQGALRECGTAPDAVARVHALLEQRAPVDKAAIAKQILVAVTAPDAEASAEGDPVPFAVPHLKDRCLQFLTEHADLAVTVSRRKNHLLPEPCGALIKERVGGVIPTLLPEVTEILAIQSADTATVARLAGTPRKKKGDKSLSAETVATVGASP